MPTARALLLNKRAEFEALVPQWKHDMSLSHGHVANRFVDLQGSFYDWLESKQKGLGDNFLATFRTPRLWRALVKKYLGVVEKGRIRHSNSRFYIYLNYEVTSKTVVSDKLTYTVCEHCGSTVVGPISKAWQPTDEEILKAWEELKAREKKT